MGRLEDLESKLNAAKSNYQAEQPKTASSHTRDMNLGIRAFMEMLGVLLGSGLIGWMMDSFLKPPCFLISFVILGIMAAFFNLYKLSRNLGTAIGSNSLQYDEKAANKPSKNES